MPTLEFPSPTHPGHPGIDLDLPDGWEAASGLPVGIALAAVRPLPADEFRANVVVRVDEVSADHTPALDLDAVAERAAELPEGAAGAAHVRTIGGLTFFGRDVAYVAPDAGTLLVSTLFGYLRRDVDRRVLRVTVTGTIGSYRPRADVTELHEVLGGLCITPAPGTTAIVDEAAAR